MLIVKLIYVSALTKIVAEKQRGNPNSMKTVRGERRQQFYYRVEAIFSTNEKKSQA